MKTTIKVSTSVNINVTTTNYVVDKVTSESRRFTKAYKISRFGSSGASDRSNNMGDYIEFEDVPADKKQDTKSRLPDVFVRIDELFKHWLNPKGLKGDSFPLEALHIAALLDDFVLKWYVTEDELKEAADYVKGSEIVDGVLKIEISEFQVELAVRDEPILTHRDLLSRLD
jgi:hypothetical protein